MTTPHSTEIYDILANQWGIRLSSVYLTDCFTSQSMLTVLEPSQRKPLQTI